MKKLILTVIAFAFAFAAQAQQGGKRFFLEPADFVLADWVISGYNGQRVITTESSNSEPFLLVEIPGGGEGAYNVWAFGCDFEKQAPGTRSFKITANEEETTGMGGTHLKDGFAWQNLGKLNLNKGLNKITIKRVGMFPRCAAICFTKEDSFTPNGMNASLGARKHARVKVLSTESAVFESEFSKMPALKSFEGNKRIGIQNKDIRILFTQRIDDKGNKFFERSVELFKDGKWIKRPDFKDEYFFLGYEAEDPKYDDFYFSSWKQNEGIMRIKTDSYNLEAEAGSDYPYAPQEMYVMRPKNIERISDRSLKLDLGDGAKAILTLAEDSPLIKYEFSAPIEKDGWYTSGMTGFSKIERNSAIATQMPPLFQMRMTMKTPKQLGVRFMSQPLSLVQTNDNGNIPYTNVLIADPDKLPSEEWSWRRSSLYGFSLASPDNKVQPAIFQPVMGGRGSFKKAGETIESSWYALSVPGTWFDAIALANEKLLPAGEFVRESFDTSFSDAAANLAAFLKNESASGWSRKYKGRWNIEDKTLVTHSSPLTEIEVALLTDDEEYYKNISLPTIEYTLTRQSSHFAPRKERSPYSPTPYAMSVPSNMWKADYYAGVNRLLGNTNPWFDEFTVVDLNKINMYSSQPGWTQLFGLWLANPSDELLKKTCELVDQWLDKAFFMWSTNEADYSAFANVSFYPYWWYLPDLYEATKNPRYLDFARRGAFHTLAAQWAYPRPSKGEITINKGNIVSGIGHIWWRDAERYRLGSDTQEAARALIKDNPLLKVGAGTGKYIVKEKKIPDAKKVSRIGVGMEQPSTFRCGGDYNDFNILMPSWSAEMLKTYQYSGDEIIRKYSRHAIIGRYATFFGYYICDYTDLPHDPDYSTRGPDITSYYYHHAPCHFAQTFDYLMTQFEIASKGAVKFPYVRQQGYVWFTDRIFGQNGKVYGDEARILLDKNAVRPSSPKVSTLGARAKDYIYVMLLNDSEDAREVSLDFDAQSKLMQGAKTDVPAELLDVDGKPVGSLQFFGEKKIKMPPYGFFLVKIPAESKEIAKNIPPISEGGHIKKEKASETFGDMHAFRIRSPFGKDSLYVMMTGGVETKAKLTVEMSSPSAQKIVCDEFPYEISVYPLPMDKPIKFKATIQEEGKAPEVLGEFEMKP